MLVGSFVFGFVMSNISEMMAGSSYSKTQYSIRMAELHDYLSSRGVAPDMKYRVHDYFERKFPSGR